MHFDIHKDCDSDQLFQELSAAGVPVVAVYPMGSGWIRITTEPWARPALLDNVVDTHVRGAYQAPSSATQPHTHPQSEISGLDSALAGKCATNDSRLSDARTPVGHSHAVLDVTGLDPALGAIADSLDAFQIEIDAKTANDDPRLSDARTPLAHNHDQSYVQLNDSRLTDSRNPTAHSHAQSDITGLTAALASKCDSNDARLSDSRNPLAHSHAQSDVTGLVTALSGKQATSEKGAANGYASLGSDGKVPSAQLPSSGGDISGAWPVGSVFISMVATSPATLLGFGTWAALAAGRVLVGIDPGDPQFDAARETGGAKTHTLTANEMPSHTHVQDAHNHTQNSHTHTQDPHTHVQNAHQHTAITASNTAGTSGSNPTRGSGAQGTVATTNATAVNQNATATNQAATATNNAATATNQTTGGGAAHNNLQPYLVAYFWERTA